MKRIEAFDGVRGLAILLVVAGHCWEGFGNINGFSGWLAPMLANSSLGVRLFFVLSGFLITSLLRGELTGSGTLRLRRFYMRRGLRILPAFYSFLGCIILLEFVGVIHVSGPQIFAAGTFTWNYLSLWHTSGPAEGSWFLGHLWTLSLEQQFYMFWPIVLLVIGVRRGFLFAVSAAALMPLIRVISYFVFPQTRGQLGMMFHTGLDSIMIGCAFALLPEYASVHKRVLAWLFGPFLKVILVGVFFVSPWLHHLFKGAYSITIGFTLDAIGAGLLLLGLQSVELFPRLHRVFTIRWLVYIGQLSYSWYLWQQLFLTPLNRSWAGQFPVNIACSFVVALCCHYWIERPLLYSGRSHFAARVTSRLSGDSLRQSQ